MLDELQRRADEMIYKGDRAEEINRATDAPTLTGVVDSWTETTLVSALLYYGLACADGTHCVDALRKIGHDKAADVLADALAERNG